MPPLGPFTAAPGGFVALSTPGLVEIEGAGHEQGQPLCPPRPLPDKRSYRLMETRCCCVVATPSTTPPSAGAALTRPEEAPGAPAGVRARSPRWSAGVRHTPDVDPSAIPAIVVTVAPMIWRRQPTTTARRDWVEAEGLLGLRFCVHAVRTRSATTAAWSTQPAPRAGWWRPPPASWWSARSIQAGAQPGRQ